MVVVNLKGGLGNQMFEYAAGRALSLKYNAPLLLDTAFLLDRSPREQGFVYRNFDLPIFNLTFQFADSALCQSLIKRSSNPAINRILNKVAGPRNTFLREPYFHFYDQFFEHKPPVYLDGYWQSEKYFKAYEETIRSDFSFRLPLSDKSQLLLQKIKSCNAVCVNVRRGDFVTNPVHGTKGTDYYQQAEEKLSSSVTNPVYFIFSDDIDWCRNNLRFNGEMFFADHTYAGEKFHEYLQLMTACNHFIIPNSSFGWWAAWLGKAENKSVIAPVRWFGQGDAVTTDIYPDGWITI